MPIYEYRCRDCDARFEVLQRVGQGAEGLVCPRCGADRVEKQFSTFASLGASASPPWGSSAGSCGSGGFT
jgi:putative FmdB family regulatory protein